MLVCRLGVTVLNVLGERLRVERKVPGLTQTELAGRLETTKGCISLYEQGRRTPDVQTLQRMARTLGVSVDYLIGETSFRERRSGVTAPPRIAEEVVIEQLRGVAEILERAKRELSPEA